MCCCPPCVLYTGSLLGLQGAAGATTSEAQRRNAFLQQLRNRLAAPSTDETEAEGAASEPELNLKRLVTKHGMEDWMQVCTHAGFAVWQRSALSVKPALAVLLRLPRWLVRKL